jgi:MoaA/NifB/PqqE/SkfB family radical SAM enzyme
VAPDWVLEEGPAEVVFRSILSSRVVRFDGALKAAISSGAALEHPALRAMAAVDSTIASILSALRAGAPQPWNRASILKGSGWGQLFLELTAQCNERCSHCYAESSPERTEELPLDVALSVLDDAKKLGFRRVQLTGGDPLIARGVLPIAERVRELDFDVLEIYTNGLALVGTTFERLRDLRATFAFSFYSLNPEVHDLMTRTPGSQVRTLRAIERARAAGLETRIGIVVTDANRSEVEATVAFLRRLGFADEDLGIDVARGVGRGVFTGDVGALRGVLGGGAGHRATPSDVRFEGTACVGSDGMVFPCIFSRHLLLGSVFEKRLCEVLEHDSAIRSPDGAQERDLWGERLTCLACRVRSSLLVPEGAPPGARPAALRVLPPQSPEVSQ